MTSQRVDRPVPATDLIGEAEVRTAARTLLKHPLLFDGGGHDDVLRLVKRHRAELSRLFADGLGYRLVVEPNTVRLFKTGLGRDDSRAFRRRSGTAFTPRGYALLALTVAALTRLRAQLMVDELVAAVRSAAAEAGVDVDLDSIADRRALHGALLALTDLGVLSERDGDLDHWAEQQTLSLLDVHRDRLALLVAAPLGGCRSADDVISVTAVPSAVGGSRVAVRRKLAEKPVLSTDELTEEQAQWWARNRNREKEWFHKALGLELELRAEGAAALDPDGELTDRAFPAGGSARHFALLLLEAVVNDIRDGAAGPWASVAVSTIRQHADAVFATWREGFRKAHRDDPDTLFDEALTILADAGLMRREGSTVQLHAAGARFATQPELVAPAAQRSLLDEEDA